MSKSKDSEVLMAVLNYINKQNRPYSAIDIFNNLHKVHGKTALTRALEVLAADKKIVEKTYGKQKIYYSDQSQYKEVSDDELKALDSLTVSLTASLNEIHNKVKTCEAELTTLCSSLTTEQVTTKIKELEEENGVLENKLENLRNASCVVSTEEKEAVYKKYNAYLKEWRSRKRTANEMLNAILEGYPNPKKKLYEELGIETDEDLNLSIPK